MALKTTKPKQNYIAGISLGVMGVGFAATLPFHDGSLGLRLLQGGFEAGLVGGLADWFAVTALFRHPLGIPIPHTALLPKNREKLTGAVISMIETELLRKESIGEKIRSIRIAELGLAKVREGVEAGSYNKAISAVLANVIQHMPVAEISRVLSQEIRQLADRLDEKWIIHRLMEEVTVRGYDEKLLDLVLERAQDWAARIETRDMLGRIGIEQIQQLKMGGLMQFAVNAFIGYLSEDKLGDMIQNFILGHIINYKDPDNPNRAKLLALLHAELREAVDRPGFLEEVRGAKHRLLDQWVSEDKIEGYIQGMLNRAGQFVMSNEFHTKWLNPFLLKLLGNLEGSPERIQQGEEWIQRQIIGFIEKHYSKIGALVRENLDKLSNEELVTFIEGKVGRDLQWIRINGAICGFLVGVVLSAVRALV
ncbi:DUF445 domain-containing protein [Paenibacillus sp. J22TS3]|uniref:DUF445 domain-containing protein n=1 Tax=Paenibacillus sp. J22TS3 TaxID=2807192 RepID=UPI001B2310CF|nr:DUF445 domain-containing protein [Paenibacillus sp. J22TS3]GIP23927.1 hypothetical protein J22TS3_42020 [Paenibacillus sp. J22TS3]